MMAQIDLPATEYFPEDYREIQLAPSQSLCSGGGKSRGDSERLYRSQSLELQEKLRKMN
jgi:hypothetical protein